MFLFLLGCTSAPMPGDVDVLQPDDARNDVAREFDAGEGDVGAAEDATSADSGDVAGDVPGTLMECVLGVPGTDPPACGDRFLTCRIGPDGETSCGSSGAGQLLDLCAAAAACDREMQCLQMGEGDDLKCWYFCQLDGSTPCPVGPLGVLTNCRRPDELLFPGESVRDVDARALALPAGVGFCY